MSVTVKSLLYDWLRGVSMFPNLKSEKIIAVEVQGISGGGYFWSS